MLKFTGNLTVTVREVQRFKTDADGKRIKAEGGGFVKVEGPDATYEVPMVGIKPAPAHTQAKALQRASLVAENLGDKELAAAALATAMETARLHNAFYEQQGLKVPIAPLTEAKTARAPKVFKVAM
jgi:hypothetical protein